MAACPESATLPETPLVISRPRRSARARSSSHQPEPLMSRVARLAQSVLAQQLAQVLAVDLGGARRGRQVSLVALDQRLDVRALEALDDAGFRFLERQVDVHVGGGAPSAGDAGAIVQRVFQL